MDAILSHRIGRRGLIKGAMAMAAVPMATRSLKAFSDGGTTRVRRFHASISIDAFKADPELLDIIKAAGIDDVWVSCFLQGTWHHSIEEVNEWNQRIEQHGMGMHQITVPFGHPSFTTQAPDYMPPVDVTKWKPGKRPNGQTYFGVSLHPPITEANVEAIKKIKTTRPGTIFLDDDFRLAPGPGDIGGCFCDEHKARFLQSHGYNETQWQELLHGAENHVYSPILMQWVRSTCDELTASFKAQQEAALPESQLGIMVMFLGSERAGIRLPDYTGVPMRVGELMFDDRSFNPLRGKTHELFSALMHRRFTTPELAFSENTAWPPNDLSAANMAAKLCISTLGDIRNTMFMSGLTPFPRTHWETLGPAMKSNAEIHQKLHGHVPRGPFKHFWGERSRCVGDDQPYSLFLALGVPFEVTGELVSEGWTFLSDFDVQAVTAGEIRSPGTKLVQRPTQPAINSESVSLAEEVNALFAWRKEILPQLKGIPYVEEERTVVCGWYPSARSVVLWNLDTNPQSVTLRFNEIRRPVTLPSLGIELIENVG
jgi:hypothetical protein